ncbi:hypothetical protein ACSL103130_09880 [Actinomyces slackii]|uniref:Uncharacterized protein n=1 Tax=Actinomyces slackii TaxID=52774 RepID=A0A448KFQ1_9ACTO|nr:hypothetical protein [Actinomyces slackii]VEG75773.1 Uncharacterised protein [Actinomyces slackii]
MSDNCYLKSLVASGWNTNDSVLEALAEAGVPQPTEDYLAGAFRQDTWSKLDRVCKLMSANFAECKFADSVHYGALLVTSPNLFDVRPKLQEYVRSDQTEIVVPDFVDERLGEGVNNADLDSPWTLFATVVSDAGLAMGSYNDVVSAHQGVYSIDGVDTRRLMTRQLWCSLVLQNLVSPDSELRARWTSTLFVGEGLVDGKVASGTVLHGQVRQRLGKPTRGSSPMRVRPAVRIAAAKA